MNKLHDILHFLFVDGVSIPIPKFLTKKVLYLGFPKTAIYMVPGFFFAFVYVKLGEVELWPIYTALCFWLIGLFSFFYFKLFPKQFKRYSDNKVLLIVEELKEKGIILDTPPGFESWNVHQVRKWINSLGLRLK